MFSAVLLHTHFFFLRLLHSFRRGDTYHFDAGTTPPQFLYLTVTWECNLRCPTCEFLHGTEQGRSVWALEDKLRVLEDFARLNPQGRVCLWGGEPLKRFEDFKRLAQRCHELGLQWFFVTNGTLIRDAAMAREIIALDPFVIMLSLDSHRSEVHDAFRGVPGSHQRALHGFHLLLEERRRKGAVRRPWFVFAFLIMDVNYQEMEAYIDLARSHHADQVLFQQYMGCGPHYPKDRARFIQVIDHLEQKYADDPFVGLTSEAYALFKKYHDRRSYFTDQPYCGSFEKNVVVDTFGNARLCFLGPIAGDLRKMSLVELWRAERTQRLRACLSTCRLKCGLFIDTRRDNWRAYHMPVVGAPQRSQMSDRTRLISR